MARLPEYVSGNVGGVQGPFRDVQTELGLRRQLWAQVVDVLSDANRQIGIVSGTIIVGNTVTISGEVTVSGPVEITGPVDLQMGGYPVSETNPVFVEDVWETITISAFTGTATDRVYTIPAAYREYYINHIFVTFTTTGGGAVRQLEVQFRDGDDNVILPIVPGVTQASGNTYRYAIGPALADHLGVRDGDYVMTPMPPNVLLPAGYDVRVFDNNLIGIAADSIVVRMQAMRPQA